MCRTKVTKFCLENNRMYFKRYREEVIKSDRICAVAYVKV